MERSEALKKKRAALEERGVKLSDQDKKALGEEIEVSIQREQTKRKKRKRA